MSELFSSFEQRIFRQSVAHISRTKADFYKNCYSKIWTKVSARKKKKNVISVPEGNDIPPSAKLSTGKGQLLENYCETIQAS